MNGLSNLRPLVCPSPVLCLFLAVAFWLAMPPAATASPTNAVTVSASFAESDGWGIRRLFSSLDRRKTVQICCGVMALSLYIIIMRQRR